MSASPQITFADAVTDGLRRWKTTVGVASRPQFWYWFLFTVLVSIVAMTADAVFLRSTVPPFPDDVSTMSGAEVRTVLDAAVNDSVWSFGTAVSVLFLVPTLTVTMRRFRDAGVSPVFGAIISLVNPVATVVVVWASYQLTYVIDEPMTNESAGTLLIAVLGLLGLAASTLTAFIIMIVIGVRPTKTSASGNRYLAE
jgi:uncharacterized membrane protein YhaH (DUF805 family)